jgi:AGZA family xanthine/uracil permease-like MFS transporter
VTITSFTENFSTSGICALLALVGLFITAVLYIKNVNGAILLGIIATWVIGMLCQVAGIYVPDNVAYFSLFPTWGLTDFSKLGETFGQCFKVDFSTVSIANFLVIMCSFLFVDLFDTLGTLIGVATKADMIDSEGKLPGIKPALLADAIGTTAGAVLGTSTVTTFVESASGVAAGGRTGLTALTTGVLFLASTLFAPIFTAIPSFATAPALIMVGFLMVGTVSEIRFELDNLTEAIPAYLAIIAFRASMILDISPPEAHLATSTAFLPVEENLNSMPSRPVAETGTSLSSTSKTAYGSSISRMAADIASANVPDADFRAECIDSAISFSSFSTLDI